MTYIIRDTSKLPLWTKNKMTVASRYLLAHCRGEGRCFCKSCVIQTSSYSGGVYLKSNCSFKAKKSTIDTILSFCLYSESAVIKICAHWLYRSYQRFWQSKQTWILSTLSIVGFSHDVMTRANRLKCMSSEHYHMRSGVNQGCFLAHTLFRIYLVMYVLQSMTDGTFSVSLFQHEELWFIYSYFRDMVFVVLHLWFFT